MSSSKRALAVVMSLIAASTISAVAQDGFDALDDLLDGNAAADAGQKVEAAEEKAEQAAEAVAEEVAAVADAATEEAGEVVEAAEEIAEAAVEEIEAVEEKAGEAVEPVAETVEEETVEVAEKTEPVADDSVAEPPVEPVAEPAEKAFTSEEALVSEIQTLERMRLKALEEHGKASLASARRALRDGNFKEAETLYGEALEFIIDREGNEKMRAEAEEGVAEAIYRQAVTLYKKGDRQGAVQKARVAREKGHPKAPELVAKIEDEIENPPEPPPPQVVSRWREKDYQDLRADIARRMRRARQYYVTGEYDRSRDELEIILRDNPQEIDAIELLRKVNERAFDYASSEFSTTRTRMIREVRDTWNPRTYAVDTVQLDLASPKAKAGQGNVSKDGKTPEEIVREKMTNIVLPEISFRAANINDVVAFFESASREHDDPNLPPEQRGVNFVLKQPSGEAAGAAPEVDDIFASADSSSSAPAGFGTPITLSARFVSLLDALQIVTDVANLKYRIKNNVVMIMPYGTATDDIVQRSYNVLPTLQERVSSVRSEMGSSSRRDGGGFMETESIGDDRADWKEFFKTLGVEWPDGSQVAYIPSIGKLQVANTEENLSKLESVLEQLNVTPSQIEIEARFIEVAQEDLESIGMEWLLSDNWEIATKKGTGAYEGSQRIIMKAGSPSTGLRYPNQTGTATALGLDNAVADSVATVASVLTNPELSFVLHLLSQRTNTDLLQAPKVVTKSGQEAIIKVVTEYIYPTSYSTETIDLDTSGDGTATFADSMVPGIVTPEDFEMREVGVILQVVPEVSQEGQMINLTLNPQVVQFEKWEDYGIESYRADGTVAWKLPMRQPFFNVRSVNTSISIYNGATVVMGGMIEEKRYEVDDKIPFLGDIPLIGRFFRSHSESSTKKNLLIFVTARLVDPAGRSLKASDGTTGSTIGAAEAVKAD